MGKRGTGLFFFLGWAAALLLPASLHYNFTYVLNGNGQSRTLLFIPFRVYYEASASIDFSATPQPDGTWQFVYSGIPRSAYVLRTLGFSARSLALLTADIDADWQTQFADTKLAEWRLEAPEYAQRIRRVARLPHLLIAREGEALRFTRDPSGIQRQVTVNLQTPYRWPRSPHGLYFNVFSMAGEGLKLFNHAVLPLPAWPPDASWPEQWSSAELDFTPVLDSLAHQIEKIVAKLVKVQQKGRVSLTYRLTANNGEEVELCGEARPDVPIWKGVLLREVFRRVRLRWADGVLLADQMWLGIRNRWGKGGFVRVDLHLVE